MSKGPLDGYRIIELAGIGPGPMAGMLLADFGADVVRIERGRQANPLSNADISFRGKRSIIVDLKTAEGRELLLRLVERSDALIEGFRPGVVERLGIGPADCAARNAKLVYGRITGWGQHGPLAQAAGHDINYIALTGALHAIGAAEGKPSLPLNLVGDMGGGGMLLALGVLAALLEAGKSGQGQVVDAAMVEGAALLMWLIHSWRAQGQWDANRRGANLVDGGTPFYDVYETLDGQYVSIGPLEPQFYHELLVRLGLDSEKFADQYDKSMWPELRTAFSVMFSSKSREEWQCRLEGTDVCFAPVLRLDEVHLHPHNISRDSYQDIGGVNHPAPAPRFSRTPGRIRHGAKPPGADTLEVLREIGYSEREIERLAMTHVVSHPDLDKNRSTPPSTANT